MLVPLFPDPGDQETEHEDQEEEEEQEEEQAQQEETPLPQPPEGETPQPNYYERIRTRVQEDATIKKDLKLYFKSKYNEARKRTAFKKYAQGKKQEIKNSVDNLREQLRGLIQAQKRTILQSQAYKDFKGAHFRRQIVASNIYKKHHLDLNDIRKAMAGQPGFKRWSRESRWRSSPSYILRRSFYRSYLRI